MLLEKLIPKLPAYGIAHWDGFLGVCFVLAALFQGVTTSSTLFPFGFGLIFFWMSRKNWYYVGEVRTGNFSPSYKRTLAYPKVLAGTFWFALCLVCFRYAAINFQVVAPWLRWAFRY